MGIVTVSSVANVGKNMDNEPKIMMFSRKGKKYLIAQCLV
jgi:hypothetical protein